MFFVLGAVRKNYLTAKATDADVEAVIKEWLKFAPSASEKRPVETEAVYSESLLLLLPRDAEH